MLHTYKKQNQLLNLHHPPRRIRRLEGVSTKTAVSIHTKKNHRYKLNLDNTYYL